MEEMKYPGSSYQNLFDYLHEEHGLTLLESEMNDLIDVVHKFHPQAGAMWVKAKGGMPEGIYSMKLVSNGVEMRGTGLVNHGAIQLITFLNKSTMGIDDLPKDYEGIYYLDESGTPAAAREEGKLTQIRADFIREANNRDINGVAAGRKKDAVEFAEWIELEGMWQGKHDKKWRRWTNELIANTTAQLYELFKQQKNP